MDTNIRKEINALHPFSKQKAASIIARYGEAMNKGEISLPERQLIDKYPNSTLFTVSISKSLFWAGYAKDTKEFLELSINYFAKGNENIFKKLNKLSLRFGPERLGIALKSWKNLLNELEDDNLSRSFSVGQLSLFQQEVFNKAAGLSKMGKFPGIGAWMFCGPFKIMIACREEIWNDPELDSIWMPLGGSVIRGLKFLKTKGLDIHPELLYEEEPGLLEGMGTVHIAQDCQKQFAKLIESKILHINSGLYKLGTDKN